MGIERLFSEKQINDTDAVGFIENNQNLILGIGVKPLAARYLSQN